MSGQITLGIVADDHARGIPLVETVLEGRVQVPTLFTPPKLVLCNLGRATARRQQQRDKEHTSSEGQTHILKSVAANTRQPVSISVLPTLSSRGSFPVSNSSSLISEGIIVVSHTDRCYRFVTSEISSPPEAELIA